MDDAGRLRQREPGKALAVQRVGGRVEQQLGPLVAELGVVVAIKQDDPDAARDHQTAGRGRVPEVLLPARHRYDGRRGLLAGGRPVVFRQPPDPDRGAAVGGIEGVRRDQRRLDRVADVAVATHRSTRPRGRPARSVPRNQPLRRADRDRRRRDRSTVIVNVPVPPTVVTVSVADVVEIAVHVPAVTVVVPDTEFVIETADPLVQPVPAPTSVSVTGVETFGGTLDGVTANDGDAPRAFAIAFQASTAYWAIVWLVKSYATP